MVWIFPLLQSIILDMISITRMWYIWQRIDWKKRFKQDDSNTHTKHEYEPLSYSIVIKKTYTMCD